MMNFGPFKFGNNTLASKVRVSAKELLDIISTIDESNGSCRANIIGSRRFVQNELVTVKAKKEDKVLAIRSVDGDRCYMEFRPATVRDAVLNYETGTIGVTDDTGAGIRLNILNKHNLPYDFTKIIPVPVNEGATRGESALFTGAMYKMHVDLCENTCNKLKTAVLKEVNYVSWLVMAAVSEAGHLVKDAYTLGGITMQPNFNEDTGQVLIDGTISVVPENTSVVPTVFQKELETAIRNRIENIKNTPGTVKVHIAPNAEECSMLNFSFVVNKEIRAFNPEIIKENSNLSVDKLKTALALAFPGVDIVPHLAYYTVPVDMSNGNSVYTIIVGLGVTKFNLVLDALNKLNLMEDEAKLHVMDGTESWMMRVYFKDQTK